MTFVQVQESGISNISIFRYWDRKPKSLTIIIAYFQTMYNLLYTMQDKISGVQVCLWTEMLALFLGLTTAQVFIASIMQESGAQEAQEWC